MSGLSIAKSLELHLLHPLITLDEVRLGCERAAEQHLATVCVWPAHVALAVRTVAGSSTRVRAAVGLPFGQDVPATKLVACDNALADGAHELAIMLDHAALAPGGDPAAANAELDRLLSHAWWSSLGGARGRAELTIVMETMLLDLPAAAPLLQRLHDTPAGFIQTGSGHQPRAVTEQHLRELREQLPDDISIIAVGGIATHADADALITAGAVRIGSWSAISIIEEERTLRALHNAP